MKVSQVAKAAQVNPETVRFYTREGLLSPRRNADNGYQIYDAEDLHRLRFARKARRLGFGLQEIRGILQEADDHHSPCPMVRELFEQRLTEMEEKISELVAMRDRMKEAMAAWQNMPDGTPDGHTICQLIEHWDEDAREEQDD